MDASRLVQTLFGSAAIIGSGVLGFTLMTNTIVAQTNFNKQQCRIHRSLRPGVGDRRA